MPSKTIKTVDFVPEYNENYDFKKVSEYDVLKQNSIMLSIFNLVCMEKGSNQLFPEMGVKDLFMSIPYEEKEKVTGILGTIGSEINRYINSSVSVVLDTDKTNFIDGDVAVNIEVEGVPVALSIHTDRNGLFKVHKYSIYNR